MESRKWLESRAGYYFTPDPDEDGWIAFQQTDGGRIFEAKFEVRDGRCRAIGFRIDDGRPLTADDLRTPRLAELAEVYRYFLVTEREDLGQLNERLRMELAKAETRSGDRSGTLAADLQAQTLDNAKLIEELDVKLEGVAEPDLTKRRGPGAAPPTDIELMHFARALLEEQQIKPRGAVTRTAQRLSMNRTTVYRWAKACHQKGYLPSEEN